MSAFYKLIVLYFFAVSVIEVQAQEFGGNAPSIKWKHLKISQANIIFPPGMDWQAIHIANILQQVDSASASTIGSRSKPINLVLQNQTTISNGYVSLGPFRSEFFLTPLQNSFELGSLPWSDQLAIHEYRHVQQYNNFNVGLSKIFSTVFGQQGQAFANNVAIPDWFFEGDAVYNETYFSGQGRGRLPFFFNPYRSLWQQQKKYNWQTLRNGSYKKFIPDHYALGYLLAAYGRNTYGDAFWKNVTHDAASFKGLFYPFQKAVKKYSGISYKTFRQNAVNFFKTEFYKEDSTANQKKFVFKDEEYPVFVNDDSIILVRTSFDKPHQFVLFTKHAEKILGTKGVSIDNHFSYAKNKIVYATYRPDIRWGYKDFSELETFDIITRQHKRLTVSSKYFSPSFSFGADSIVAVHVDPGGKSSIDILSAKDGKKILSVPNTQNLFYTYPIFVSPQKIISAVRNYKGEMSVQQIDLATMSATFILPFSYNVIAFPFYKNDTLYFSSSYNKKDKIFCYTFKDEQLLSLNFPFAEGIGQYQFNSSANEITYSTFTADGFRVQHIPKSSITFLPFDLKTKPPQPSNFGIASLNNYTNSSTPKNNNYRIAPYSKAKNLVAFHSVQPYVSDPEYAITIVSDNILNTLQAQAAYTYNRSERFSKFSLSGVYGGLFPLLSVSADYSVNRRGLYNGEMLTWNEFEPGIGVSVPLNLSRLNHLTYLNISTRCILNSSQYKAPFKDSFKVNTFSYFNNSISISNQVQSARKNIFPKWAQTLSVNYKSAVTGYSAAQFSANSNLYLPGVIKNHSLILNGAYLVQSASNQVNFSSNFPFSKGYLGQNLQQMYKFGINYHLPLSYPDIGFGNIAYLLRLRTNLFYDHTYAKDKFSNGLSFNAYFRSAGTELYFDTKWWNVMPVSFGIRYSYLLDEDLFGGNGSNRIEFILPVNLFR